MTKATISEQRISVSDGTELFVKQYHVANPKAQVLIIHGYLEHCQRYGEYAEYLNTQGIAVTLYDFRGHGLSSGKRAFVADWQDYVTDFESVVATLLPNVPTFWLAHSNGGLLLLHYLLSAAKTEKSLNIKGAIISSPFLKPAGELSRVKKWLSQILGSLFPGLQVPSDLKVEDLMSDPELQKKHEEDKLCIKQATMGWVRQALFTQASIEDYIEEKIKIPYPVFFTFAGADRVADPTQNEKIAERLLAQEKIVQKQEGELHEVFNSINRKEIYEATGKWMLDRV